MILYVVYNFWYIVHKIYNFEYVTYIEFLKLSKIAVREKYFHLSPCTYLWEKSLIDIFLHKNKIEDRINNEPYLILAISNNHYVYKSEWDDGRNCSMYLIKKCISNKC